MATSAVTLALSLTVKKLSICKVISNRALLDAKDEIIMQINLNKLCRLLQVVDFSGDHRASSLGPVARRCCTCEIATLDGVVCQPLLRG